MTMNNSCGQPTAIRFRDLHEDCADMAVNVFGYVIPVLSVIVTTINILIILVFTKKRMRSHTTFILTLIACAEIINIVCPAIVFSYLYLRGNYKQYLTAEQIKYSYVLGKICVDMFNMFSLWLTVLLAFIRCRCINSPFEAKRLYSFRKIIIHIVLIIIFVCFVHIPSFFIFEFHSNSTIDPDTNLTLERGVLLETEGAYFKTCVGRKFHVFVETITDSLLPTVVLVGCNINILVALRKAKKSRVILRHKENDKLTCNDNKRKDGENVGLKSNLFSINDTLDKDVEFEKSLTDESHKSSYKQAHENLCKQEASCGKESKVKLPFVKCVKLHNIFTSKAKQARARLQSDSTLDKLDKEGQRTSYLILLVSTIIAVHELPLAILNIYTLVNSSDKPLPLSHGCLSIYLLLWQFITYPALFLIYACMSKMFRKQLWKVLACICVRLRNRQQNKKHSLSAKGGLQPYVCQSAKPSRLNRSHKLNTL